MLPDLFQSIRLDGQNALEHVQAAQDLTVKNSAGEGLLHEAIAAGNMPVLEHLLQAGLDVNCQDSRGQTPLHFAAAYQNRAAARMLLDRGGDLSLADLSGNTPLWTAVFNARGKHEVVELLIERGAGPYSQFENRRGKTPLGFARLVGDQVLVDMLQADFAAGT